VYYKTSGNGLYEISYIIGEVIRYSEVSFDQKYCAAGAPFLSVPQSFSIKFVADGNSINARSGNPGYISGKPLMIAQNTLGVKDVNQNGFRLFAGDKDG
jgi:hypothetical protein